MKVKRVEINAENHLNMPRHAIGMCHFPYSREISRCPFHLATQPGSQYLIQQFLYANKVAFHASHFSTMSFLFNRRIRTGQEEIVQTAETAETDTAHSDTVQQANIVVLAHEAAALVSASRPKTGRSCHRSKDS